MLKKVYKNENCISKNEDYNFRKMTERKLIDFTGCGTCLLILYEQLVKKLC
jgi:hypothetical protein